jgi:hypothetical protein
MKSHEIKRDKFQYIIKHPWGCPQRKAFESEGKYTYITQKVNLPWELRQCGMSEAEIGAFTQAVPA